MIKTLQEKQVDIHFFKNNLSFKVNNTANPLKSLLFNVLGSLAQFERDIIVERTSEGKERENREVNTWGVLHNQERIWKEPYDYIIVETRMDEA